MTHWAEKYIGKPWQNGVQGPDAFDCYGLVRAVFLDRLGIHLPIIDVDAYSPLAIRHAMAGQDEYANWISPDDGLADFDVVLMSAAKQPHHVGVWTANGMLHAIEGSGVVHQNRQSLALHGWNIVRIYRRKVAA